MLNLFYSQLSYVAYKSVVRRVCDCDLEHSKRFVRKLLLQVKKAFR